MNLKIKIQKLSFLEFRQKYCELLTSVKLDLFTNVKTGVHLIVLNYEEKV